MYISHLDTLNACIHLLTYTFVHHFYIAVTENVANIMKGEKLYFDSWWNNPVYGNRSI